MWEAGPRRALQSRAKGAPRGNPVGRGGAEKQLTSRGIFHRGARVAAPTEQQRRRQQRQPWNGGGQRIEWGTGAVTTAADARAWPLPSSPRQRHTRHRRRQVHQRVGGWPTDKFKGERSNSASIHRLRFSIIFIRCSTSHIEKIHGTLSHVAQKSRADFHLSQERRAPALGEELVTRHAWSTLEGNVCHGRWR